jgi:hypothetical protein
MATEDKRSAAGRQAGLPRDRIHGAAPVAAGARGSGVAPAQLGHGERVIGGRFELAWLAVASANARARRFYERLGWRDAGAIDYAAEIPSESVPVPCRRYEKRVPIGRSR